MPDVSTFSVANRVQQIRDNSSPDQWKYIESNQNPADESSRGVSPQDLVDSDGSTDRLSYGSKSFRSGMTM